jgi:hypothetical protein
VSRNNCLAYALHCFLQQKLLQTPSLQLCAGLLLQVVRGYGNSTRRLIVLGYNATLTTAVEAPRQPKRHFDQIKALTRVNPRILRCLEVRQCTILSRNDSSSASWMSLACQVVVTVLLLSLLHLCCSLQAWCVDWHLQLPVCSWHHCCGPKLSCG